MKFLSLKALFHAIMLYFPNGVVKEHIAAKNLAQSTFPDKKKKKYNQKKARK